MKETKEECKAGGFLIIDKKNKTFYNCNLDPKILKNLDYIKHQNEFLITELKKLPDKQKIEILIHLLQRRTKIEKDIKNLDEKINNLQRFIKDIDRKLTIYTDIQTEIKNWIVKNFWQLYNTLLILELIV